MTSNTADGSIFPLDASRHAKTVFSLRSFATAGKFLMFCLLYTVALLSIVAVLKNRAEAKGEKFKINFEYRVF